MAERAEVRNSQPPFDLEAYNAAYAARIAQQKITELAVPAQQESDPYRRQIPRRLNKFYQPRYRPGNKFGVEKLSNIVAPLIDRTNSTWRKDIKQKHEGVEVTVFTGKDHQSFHGVILGRIPTKQTDNWISVVRNKETKGILYLGGGTTVVLDKKNRSRK